MRFIPVKTRDQAYGVAVRFIVDNINVAASEGRQIVLGLAIGETMARVYQLLVKAYDQGIVDFAHVIAFNLDEYVGLPAEHPETSRNYMMANFYNYVNVDPENIYIMDGNAEDLQKEADEYQDKISSVGGLDLIVSPFGDGGHITYNEAYSSLNSRARCIYLTDDTIQSRAKYFSDCPSKVPARALTLGMKTILETKKILCIGLGARKAKTVQAVVEGDINHSRSASVVCQMHPCCTVIVDSLAVSELKVKTNRYFKKVHDVIISQYKGIVRESNVEEFFTPKIPIWRS